MAKLKAINLFGGPGVGKSTTRSFLFGLLNENGFNVEEVNEFAKIVTWEGHMNLFSDQLYILANQNRNLERLSGKVEWAVCDSPVLLNLNYVQQEYLPNSFEPLVLDVWDRYENFNFILKRSDRIPYNPVGRYQTKEEAIRLDSEIKNTLIRLDEPYIEIDCGDNADGSTVCFGMATQILENLKGRK